MNMQNLKENAKQFLKIEPIANKETPFIIHHPFIKYNPIIYQTRKGNIKSIDVFSNKELKKYFDRMEQLIDECKTPQQIFNLMTQPYKLYFFYLNSNKLSNNDYNNCLKDINEEYFCDLIIIDGKLGLRYSKYIDATHEDFDNILFQEWEPDLTSNVTLMLGMQDKLRSFIEKEIDYDIEVGIGI